ncbi:MAG: TlpA family protein disulfide reductase [Deltaproteobacteria bacterium]|nr:TlpA family protein disulfide reductase [Deltaproteobacteria bacterium]
MGVSFVVATTSACGGSVKPANAPGAEGGGESGSTAQLDKPAPDLSIQTINGKGSVSLASLQGKIAIIDFWATWCGPCKKSFPALEELAKKHSDRVVIVGISCDDSKDGVLDWARAQGATFPIGWDDGHQIAKRWKVEKMPTTYVLDGTGTVRFVHDGYHDDEADLITRELALLTSEPPPASASTKTEVASNDAKPDASEPAEAADAAPPPAPAKPGKKGGGKKAPKTPPSATKKASKKKKPT